MAKLKDDFKRCIYCLRASDEHNPVIVSNDNNDSNKGVCFKCVSALNEVVGGSQSVLSEEDDSLGEHAKIMDGIAKLMKPSEMVAFLNKTIISQQTAKREVSGAIYEHMKRKVVFDVTGSSKVKKANIFLLGRTGVSKTEMMNQISKITKLPMITIDCTSLSESGYVGDSVDDKMDALLNRADGDLKKAEFGIVFLDEVDKLRRSSASSQTTAVVGREGVQESLLKIIEGCEITMSSSGMPKASGRKTSTLDTSNILFVASGAFDGIEAQLGIDNTTEIGFVKSISEVNDDSDEKRRCAYRKIRSEHLIEYGFKPEFIGRFNSFVAFDDLSVDDLERVLRESELSRIGEAIYSMGLDGCSLSFSDDSYREIAEIAAKEKTGARTLGRVVDTVLRDVRYKASNGELVEFCVTKDYIKELVI